MCGEELWVTREHVLGPGELTYVSEHGVQSIGPLDTGSLRFLRLSRTQNRATATAEMKGALDDQELEQERAQQRTVCADN